MSHSETISDAQLVFDFEDSDFDRAWERVVEVERIRRGAGFCLNHYCESYLKMSFLYYYTTPFVCPKCQMVGESQAERGQLSGAPGAVIGEVRVEYGFDPSFRSYRELAVVRNEALGPQAASYTAFCPLLTSEKRALRAAESLLVSLNEGPLVLEGGSHELPQIKERVLNLDGSPEEFREELRLLERSLRENPLFSEEIQ